MKRPQAADRCQHRWTTDDRIALTLLSRLYHLSEDQIRQIFNHATRQRLCNEGFDGNGLALSTVTAQIREMRRRGGIGSKIWAAIMAEDRYRVEQDFAAFLTLLRRTAISLKIKLVSKGTLDITNAIAPNVGSGEGSNDTPALLVTDSDIISRTPDPIQQLTRVTRSAQAFDCVEIPLKPRVNKLSKSKAVMATHKSMTPQNEDIQSALRSVRVSPKLRIDKDFEGCHSRQHPRLLFRAFEQDHGFVARRFLNTAVRPPMPPGFGTSRFKNEVEPHLRVDKTYQSPVLSFTESARRALKIVKSTQPDRSLAVFDFNDVEEDAVHRYARRCRPSLVTAICQKHKLFDLQGDYTGRGEWLIWGDVKCEPIVVFDKIEVLQLESLLTTMETLDKDSGYDLGAFLKDVDHERKEILARALVSAFKIPGYSSHYHGCTWLTFAESVYAASKGNRATSIVSSVRSLSLAEETFDEDEYDKMTELSGTVTEISDEDMEEILQALKQTGDSILLKARGPLKSAIMSHEDVEETSQKLLDAQLHAELNYYTRSATELDVVVQAPRYQTPEPILPGLEQCDQATLNKSNTPASSHSSRSTLIDLTNGYSSDAESDIEVEMEITEIKEVTGTRISEDKDEYVIVAKGRRAQKALPLRSKSESVFVLGD